METIILRNFKCLDAVELPVKPLTILTGLNSMGKSSVLQSLLLMRQSFLSSTGGQVIPNLILNGYWVNIGTAKDALWEGAETDRLSLGFRHLDKEYVWSFDYTEGDDELHSLSSNPATVPEGISLFSNQFHYLRAQRLGPKTSFPISVGAVKNSRQIGADGEYAAFFLSIFGAEEISCSLLRHKLAVSNQLRHQVEAWLCEISPGTRVYTKAHPNLDLVNLEYAFITSLGETNHYRATNVGFGITYTLPIIVAVLSSRPGTIVLLENPEAHLHPQGQTKIGELLALAAKSGIHVLVETHSDHFLNGVRLSVHDRRIDPEDVAIHFFDRSPEATKIKARIRSPEIDSAGRIDFWPDGFFDESEKALSRLLTPPAT